MSRPRIATRLLFDFETNMIEVVELFHNTWTLHSFQISHANKHGKKSHCLP
jgi:hypothetical protein